MHIFVNNREAVIKAGTSIEYVSENRLFSGSDAFTMSITLPLRECAANIEIFGHINRADVSAGTVVFECEMRDRGFYKYGSLVINEINESEVKAQFLEGRSAQNFDSRLDKIYINQLELGKPKYTKPSEISPESAWHPDWNGYKYIALPWVNDSSGNIQNKAHWYGSKYQWYYDTEELSWQPYLLWLTKRICEEVGLTPDFTEWEQNDWLSSLLVCNTLPAAWELPEFARALPEWTVTEYLEKLELFLGCEFDIDYRGRRIKVSFTEKVMQQRGSVVIDNVVDEFTTEVKVEDQNCEYIGAQNVVYKDNDWAMWKYYSCPWYMRTLTEDDIVTYDTLRELVAQNKRWANWMGDNKRDSNLDKVLYAADCDTYFIIRTIDRTELPQDWTDANGIKHRYRYTCALQPVNIFGGCIVDDSQDAKETELEFVPVPIDYTEEKFGNLMYLKFSDYDEDEGTDTEIDEEETEKEREERLLEEWCDTITTKKIEAGAKDKVAAYYDRIYVGFAHGAQGRGDRTLPHPVVDKVDAPMNEWDSTAYNYLLPSLRLSGSGIVAKNRLTKIEPDRKTTFKFLADSIPDVRTIFVIKGKRYLCEKITATFTENGMSHLLKGVFYPLK